MNYKQITRINPTTGRTERPWRNRDHEFVLGDPAKGNVKHHDEHAIKVDNYGEALELVERGYSIRMSDGQTPPSLVTPASLTFSDEPVKRLDDLWTYSMPDIPFTFEQVAEDLRTELLCQAGEIFWIADQNAADSFIGFELDIDEVEHRTQGQLIDLSKFNFARIARAAYESAFRIGEYPIADDDADELELIIGATFGGQTRRYSSPLENPTSPLRRTLLAGYLRWKMSEGELFGSKLHQGAVESLAVLTGMTEQGVRNSLNKEGLSSVKGKTDYDGIISWLENRRDFFPLRENERPQARSTWRALYALRHKPISEALTAIGAANATVKKSDLERLSKPIEEAILTGSNPRTEDLRAYARLLGFNIDTFVANFFSPGAAAH